MTSKYINVREREKWNSVFNKAIRCTGSDRGLCKRCTFRFRCFTERVMTIDASEITEMYRNGRCTWVSRWKGVIPGRYQGRTPNRSAPLRSL